MSPSESNPDRLSLRLQGTAAIAQAVDAARAFGQAHELRADDLARLCIVVEELVANLYDHGGVTDRDEVQLSLARDPEGVRISIVDPGMPFDPWSSTPAGRGNGGGAGLSLIRAWGRPVSYRSSGERNFLELLLRSPGEPGDDQ